ncbi:Saxitoxin and tetrodotoxin-binding protein 1 [Oryzias melastigma]|uniref:Saxitoxin and tetrodotoxin-binding protein 1 n=1 Tax=Oryzias melastigma TaxID=30732 RepID=A0A834CRZ4_ORYME|nr:Saxitoxin and tetrodotoxin-binding protein 1 [Oryzias melastigma]
MSAGKISVLLLLAVIGSHAAPNPSKCEGLTKRLQTKDLNKIFRNWVLVWSVADHEEGDSLVSNISSSHVEFQLLPENKTISYIERNVYNVNVFQSEPFFLHYLLHECDRTIQQRPRSKRCVSTTSVRLEVDGQPVEYNDTGAVDFYETCPDCLMLVYKTSSGRYLLDYKEEGSHRDVEKHKAGHDDHKKLADCLGFPDKKAYVYDGVAGLAGHIHWK